MTFRALLYAYILGGLTFVPLLLIAVLGLGWTLLPKVDEAAESGKDDAATARRLGSEDDKKAIEGLLAKKHEEISEGGASGTFAVLRKYDFQAAMAALNARNNASGSTTGVGGGAADSGAEAGKESESVYQSMYRSVFDRGKNQSHSSSVLASEEGEGDGTPNAGTRRRATPANVFYIVLRHGHLMLYDSAAQMEIRHVVSLAHHSVSLTEGVPLQGIEEQLEVEKEVMKDGDMFIKRTAIVLTPTELPNGQLQSRNAISKPFFLFALTCSEKEDFYHSLLYTRAKPPIPEPLDSNDAIKLQSTLHSTSLTPETRALNALVGRIFLGLYHTDRARQYVQSKVEKKISRVQKPAFIASLAVKSIDLGDSAPVLSNPRLKDLHISGDLTIACDIKYTGAIKLTIAAVAKLDLGPRFKTRTVDLVLATSLQRLQGHLLLRIKPPPSNRLWFCFEAPPDMDIKVEPVVSQRQITYTFILRQIEDKIRSVVSETLVKPNWDDVPWFDTRGQSVRGGIWRDEGGESAEERAERLPTGADMLKERNNKTKSMPVLPGMQAETDSSATSSGSETASKFASGHSRNVSETDATLKRRSVASLPAQSATPPPDISAERSFTANPPLPLKSPSFNSSTPSVALDDSTANVDPVRSNEAPARAPRKWGLRNAAQQMPSRKEAVEAMREMRDKASAMRDTGMEALSAEKESESAHDHPPTAEGEDNNGHEGQISDAGATTFPDSPPSTQTSFADRSLRSAKRTDTNLSTTSTSSRSIQNQQRKQTILAATAAATNAAKTWSWNAYQNAKKNSPARAGSISSQQHPDGPPQPIGRGQPLPPPGVPLPGPNKGLFGAFGGSVKRKPVLPPRKSTLDDSVLAHDRAVNSSENDTASHNEADSNVPDSAASSSWEGVDMVQTPSDEFGPWRENSGAGLEEQEQAPQNGNQSSNMLGDDGIRVTGIDEPPQDNPTPVQKKAPPPPLPPRRSTLESELTSQQATAPANEDIPDPNVAPPAQSAEQAEAKFALGADVGEEDFENAPAHESISEGKNDGNEDTAPIDGEIIAVPAPVESYESPIDTTTDVIDDGTDTQESSLKSTSADASKVERVSPSEAADEQAMWTNETSVMTDSSGNDKNTDLL